MKENANEKSKKKITNKRKFYSAPNLPLGEPRFKATDSFLVTPDDIRKYKKDLLANVVDDKRKKSKKKAQAKKLNDKNVDKILLDPGKPTGKVKKLSEDYQWLIKKHIVKLMGAARKKIQKRNEEATEPEKRANLKKKKLDTGKKVKGLSKKLDKSDNQVSPRSRKKPPRKNQPEIGLKPRANTATIPRQSEIFPKQRSLTLPPLHRADYLEVPQGRTAMILHPTQKRKDNNYKLRDVFNVFKTKPEQPGNIFAKNEQLPNVFKKTPEIEKKTDVNKKKKLGDKQLKQRPASSTIKLERRKKKKIRPENLHVTASPKVDQPPLFVKPIVDKKTVEKKKRKLNVPKLMATISS
ncbi:hypothetical protein Zmor_025462 [Zophobas morio]|uniref:Uncharacterized protein n=1 Tax=Zophobas morio TaxID=2755281 RepID=A0AA38HRQ2_9CUCU|nr:hypothetical protein Zmor_025462 [Zophobas morio]